MALAALTRYFTQFTCLIGASVVYDILWMAKHSQNWFIRLVTIVILLLKVRACPTAQLKLYSLFADSNRPGLRCGPP